MANTGGGWVPHCTLECQVILRAPTQARIGDEGAVVISQQLSSLNKLESLDMSLNIIGDDGIEALSLTFGQLARLQVRNQPCTQVV